MNNRHSWKFIKLLHDGFLIEAFGSVKEYHLYCNRLANDKYGKKHREKINARTKARYYANHEEEKHKKREDRRKRMQDPEVRKRACKSTIKAYKKMRKDPEKLAAYNHKHNQRQRKKFREDPKFRARIKAAYQRRIAKIKADPVLYKKFLEDGRVKNYQRIYGPSWRAAMLSRNLIQTEEVRREKRKANSKEGNRKRKIANDAKNKAKRRKNSPYRQST